MTPQYFLHPAHELADIVQQTLSGHRRGWGRSVAAQLSSDGVLLLTGRVASWYHKQIAQETLRRIQGIARIHNELRVEPAV